MDEKELKAAQENLRKKSAKKSESNNRVSELLTLGKRIGSKPITHKMGDFSFDTVSVIPADIKDKFIKEAGKLKDNPEIISTLIDTSAEVMASICVEPELKDKEVWLKFNAESGSLLTLTLYMISELVIGKEELETFR